MNQPNILLTRIDNRLVHGQVGVTWVKTLGANLIVVADDSCAQDSLQQSLMSMTAKSSGAGIRFFTVEKTAQVIGNAAPEQKILLVVRTPMEARALWERGVRIDQLNVGNMHFSQGKRQISKKVYVSDEEFADLKFLEAQGVKVYIQDIPGDVISKLE